MGSTSSKLNYLNALYIKDNIFPKVKGFWTEICYNPKDLLWILFIIDHLGKSHQFEYRLALVMGHKRV